MSDPDGMVDGAGVEPAGLPPTEFSTRRGSQPTELPTELSCPRGGHLRTPSDEPIMHQPGECMHRPHPSKQHTASCDE